MKIFYFETKIKKKITIYANENKFKLIVTIQKLFS
jgi:hypothetical protein